MHGKLTLEIKGKKVLLWFNNYSKAELAKLILPEDKGHKAKPEEFPLLKMLARLVDQNHLSLMRDIIWAGYLGAIFASLKDPEFSREDIAEYLAVASESEMHSIWLDFLSSMGVNIENLEEKINTEEDPEESKKKV